MKIKGSKNMLRIGLLAGTLVSLYFVPWMLVRAWIPPIPDTVQEQVEDAVGIGFEGIVVYVDNSLEADEYYAAGWHDRNRKIPADPHALFRIASISKLYDAVAVAKLIQEGQLEPDQTLADAFPELRGRIQHADRITLKMMVQHRSGIPNLTDTPNFWIDPPKTRDEALDRILDLPASFEPGTSYQYSNSNYLLLHLLIEKVTGAGKFQYIQREILEPLGLENTHGSISESDADRLMSGYYVGVPEDIKMVDYGTELTSMVATAEDVGIFIRALNDGSVFSAGEKVLYDSLYEYGHTGLIPGYQSIARYQPELDKVVVQFTNTTDFEGYQWNLSEIVYSRVVKILKRRKAGAATAL